MTHSQFATKVVSRVDLYEQVWKTPAVKLAAVYGVSDVAIVKACHRHQIPRPPRGYWAMVQHGYTVERPPLPPLADPGLEEVYFCPEPPRPDLPPNALTPRPAASGTTCAPGGPAAARIATADRLTSPHGLVEAARRQLREAKAGGDGLVRTDGHTAPVVSVARSSITRALCILDALFKAWEQRGGEVKVEERTGGYDPRPRVVIGVGPDTLAFSLAERTEAAPKSQRPASAYYHRHPPRRPTGQLTFSIDSHWADRLRRTWSDGKRRRLEDILGDVLQGVRLHVECRRLDRLDEECEERQRRQADERRASGQRLAKHREARIERLLADVDGWHAAERVRAYVAAIRRSVRTGASRITSADQYRDYLAWASSYADHIDPLLRRTLPHDGPQPPSKLAVEELDLTRRARAAVGALGVKDTDELHGVPQARVKQVHPDRAWSVWNEFTRVLEALGYDVAGRARSY